MRSATRPGRRSNCRACWPCGCGPPSRGHTIDEHVPVAELVRAAQGIALAAMRWCGVAGTDSGAFDVPDDFDAPLDDETLAPFEG